MWRCILVPRCMCTSVCIMWRPEDNHECCSSDDVQLGVFCYCMFICFVLFVGGCCHFVLFFETGLLIGWELTE